MLWLLVQAALHKLNPANNRYYTSLIAQYGWSLQKLVPPMIISIGIIELSMAIGIVIPTFRPYCATVVALLFTGYAAHFGYHLYLGRIDLDCGCAGPEASLKISMPLLFRNLLLSLMALLCGYLSYSDKEFQLVLPVLFAVLMVILYHCCEQLIANAQKLATLRH